MGVCKTLMVCLAVLAIKASDSQSHILEDSLEECACFPRHKDGISISKLADKYGKKDRKVIYLFKHPDSEEVMIYVPNEEKQKKFPDLIVNGRETFGIPKFEHLYHIFKDQPDVSTPTEKPNDVHIPIISTDHVNDALFQHHITDTKSPIIHTKPGSTDKEIGQQITNIGDKGTSHVEPPTGHKIIALDLQNQAGNGVHQSGQPHIQIIDDIYLVPGKGKQVINKPVDQVIHNTDIISGLDQQNHLHHNDIIAPGHGDKVVDLSGKVIYPPDGANGNINIIIEQNDKVPNQLHENIIHSNKDTNVVESEIKKTQPSTHPSSGVQKNPKSSTKIPENALDIIENTFISQGTGTNFVNSLQELLALNKNSELLYPEKVKPVTSPVLDKWLFDEIQNIGSTEKGLSSLHILDLHTIKIHLLIILNQNGLSFTENGEIVDINGHRFKISNLKLRRVLISDPAVYKQLIEGRKCIAPYNIPYLEAVFVNLVYPPKVLGLIPLRVTTLPSCKGRCTSKLCRHSKKDKHIHINAKHPKKLNLSLHKKGKPEHHLRDGSIVSIEDKHLPDHIHGGISHGHGGGQVGDKTISGDSNEDGLGIRIIGGNAATSSGTPVSSRGRIKLYKPSSFYYM